jgi:hypothetical protein
MRPVVFRSRIDTWLLVVIVGSVLLSIGVSMTVLWVGGGGALVLVPLMLLGAILPAWVLLTTDYTLTRTDLRVRSGPFRWRVPLHEVRSITPTRNPLSSPALSLDRLRIEYGARQWLMIAPADKDAFLRELDRRRGEPGGPPAGSARASARP